MTDRDHLAAEYALGLLDGAELMEARGLVAGDAEFARLVEQWEERFEPLFDEYGEAEPPPGLRQRILSALEKDEGGEVVILRRRLGRWKGMAAAASAIAASLALVVAYDVTRPPPASVQTSEGEMMVASLNSPDDQMMMAAAWSPAKKELMLAGAMPAEAGRSHELWIIPADGKPRSLGVMAGEGLNKMAVAEPMAELFAGGATLAVSLEPRGGSPTGAPTGPVLASGALAKV
ncbi:MAG TPA: anti-sigma factor [Sphingomicrobium sp.]|nr:anti-sigma factor [Sphingomicrobium sp.]